MNSELGRIYFPGNPWPNGHEVVTFRWSARLEPGSGIWFDFHLETADYNAEDSELDATDNVDENDTNYWADRFSWNNFHSCLLSSTEWAWEAEFDGDSGVKLGVLAATVDHPLDLTKRVELDADKLPQDPYCSPRPFGIYLIGHDAVAEHRWSISPCSESGVWSIDWSGRIALIYWQESESFDREFRAVIREARFMGIRMPSGVSTEEAVGVAAPYLANPSDYEAVTEEGFVILKYRGSPAD